MQEMSLPLQKENEPKQEENQQAPSLPCVPTVWWGKTVSSERFQ